MRTGFVRTGRRFIIVFLLMGMALTTFTARAQSDISNGALLSACAKLDDTALAVRAAASKTIAQQASLEEVIALLEQPKLSAEQRYRLLGAARTLVFNKPRGALGVQMRWSPNRPEAPGGIVITDFVAGMPAQRVLKIDDRITHVQEVRLNNADDLLRSVQLRAPGETVCMTVVRAKRDHEGNIAHDDDGGVAYETLVLAVELGDAGRLIDPETGMPAPAESVMQVRQNTFDGIMNRHAPTPVIIAFRAISADGAGANDDALSARFTEAQQAVHAAIAAARAMRAGRLRTTEAQLDTWWALSVDLAQLSRRPELTAQEAEAFRALAEQLAKSVEEMRGE